MELFYLLFKLTLEKMGRFESFKGATSIPTFPWLSVTGR
jgi:hypothetical protein